MGKQLIFVLKLSLEEMALRRMVVNLWNEADVLASIAKLTFDVNSNDEFGFWSKFCLDRINEERWATVENEVKAKMAELVLPESLKKRMMLIIRPIGLQIRNWKIFMGDYLSDSRKNLDVNFLEQLCWTSSGAIDYQKTTEKVIRLEKFDVVTRYKLACSHCMSDSIPVLSEELPEDYKRSFRDETNLMRYVDLPMEFYWNKSLKGKLFKLEETFEKFYPRKKVTLHQYAFNRSACSGNKAATEYFFQKLSYQERDDYLIRTVYDVAVKRCSPCDFFKPFEFPLRNLSDVLCYLLSVMSPEQQMRVFKFHSLEVLPCFLDWPWQDLFLDVAGLAWTFLPETKYNHLANYIDQNRRNEGYYFPHTTQQFFLGSPSYFRTIFLWDFHSWFPEFSFADDTETLKVIFRNIDLEDRAKLVSNRLLLMLLQGLMKKGKWRLVEVCLREAVLSREDKKSLKESLYTFVLENYKDEELRHMRSRLERFFWVARRN